MMEKYFAFKYYEEVVGTVISLVIVVGVCVLPMLMWFVDLWKHGG